VLETEEKRARAAKMEVEGPRKKDQLEDMKTVCSPPPASLQGRCSKGVRFREELIETKTVMMRSVTGTVRWIRAEHRQFGKFYLHSQRNSADALPTR
jgi:fructose-1,6-bisphosphatase II / sedoheptulose-1,7-bisphosphatase